MQYEKMGIYPIININEQPYIVVSALSTKDKPS